MSTTLEVILKTAGFTEGATAIKKVGDEATNTNNKLKTTTSTVDQVSKSTTSLGSKLANAGKQFSGTITNVAALGSTVVNLSRQYSDLEDTQIRVDRTQLKVSKTAEAVRAAQDKLNKLTKAGVRNGAEYEKALLDVQQAQEASTLAVTMNGEALEDQQRAYENFAMTVVPTILTAGSSITSMFKELGGSKGFGGLKNVITGLVGGGTGSVAALKTAFSSAIPTDFTKNLTEVGGTKGLGGLKNTLSGVIGSKSGMVGLLGMAGAAAGAGFALQELFTVMEKGAKIKSLNDIITGGKATEDQLKQQIANIKDLQGEWGTQLMDFFKSGPIGKAALGDTFKQVGDEVIKSLDSQISRVEAAKPLERLLAAITNAPMDPNIKAGVVNQINALLAMYRNDVNWKAGYGATADAVAENTKKVILAGIQKLQSTLSGTDITSGLTGALRTMFTKTFKGVELGDSPMTKMFAIDPVAISSGVDKIGQLSKSVANFGSTAANSAPEVSTFNQSLSDMSSTFATVTKNIPPASIGIAGMNALMNPFNANLIKASTSLTDMAKHAQETATIGLQLNQVFSTMGTTLTPLQSTIAGLSTSEQGWVAQTQAAIAAEAKHTQTLVALINQGGRYHATVTDSAQILDLEARATLGDARAQQELTKARAADIKKAQQQARVIGSKIGGYEPGKTTGGAKYVTYRNGRVIGYGPGTAPPLRSGGGVAVPVNSPRRVKKKQHGYQGIVKRPTMFIAGEGGRPEDVTVRPRGSAQRGGGGSGGGGDIYVGPIYLDGQQIYGQLRYKMNENQGIFK